MSDEDKAYLHEQYKGSGLESKQNQFTKSKPIESNNEGVYKPAIQTSGRQEYNSWYNLDSFKKNFSNVAKNLTSNFNNMSSEEKNEAYDDIKHLLKTTIRDFEKDIFNPELDYDTTVNHYSNFLEEAKKIANNKELDSPEAQEALNTLISRYEGKFSETKHDAGYLKEQKTNRDIRAKRKKFRENNPDSKLTDDELEDIIRSML